MLFLITAVLLENGPWNKASPPIVATLGCCRRVCLCARVCGVGYSCNDDPAELEVCARPPVSLRSVFLPLSSLRLTCTLRTCKAVFWMGGMGKTCQTGGRVLGRLAFIHLYLFRDCYASTPVPLLWQFTPSISRRVHLWSWKCVCINSFIDRGNTFFPSFYEFTTCF